MFRVGSVLGCFALMLCVCVSKAVAEPAHSKRQPHFETWAGASAQPESWSAYTGTTWSPFGSILSDGWRLRFVGGYGSYTYTTKDTSAWPSRTVEHEASYGFADLLAGYHTQIGTATIKLFAGATSITHTVRPPDPAFIKRSQYGVKGALETWFNVSRHTFLQADTAYAYYFDNDEKFHDLSLRSALGVRLNAGWQVGIEAAYLSQRKYSLTESGGFVRFEWGSSAAKLSAGVSRDETEHGAYLRGSYFIRY